MQQSGEYTPRHGWYAVTVLLAAYLLSLMDRQILSLMVEPIRRDLGLSDTALSLLQGIAFALFYTLMGLPIAVLADRYNRKKIIGGGMVLWSIMTGFCGYANSFAVLFAGRIGVGFGEATLSPSAYSIMADAFPREKVARAISVYSIGGFVGPGLALLVGGGIIGSLAAYDYVSIPLLGEFRPWQATFLVLALAGIPFTLLLMTMKEPPRRVKPAGQEGSFKAWLRQLKAQRGAYAGLMGGESLIAVAGYGGLAWAPTVFIRVHEWPVGRVGLVIGIIVAVAGTAGVLSGAALAEWLRARGKNAAIPRVMALGAGLSVPFILLLMLPNAYAALAGLAVFYFCNSMPWGICGAGVQLATPSRHRAKAAATMLLATNLMGLGVGPTLVASITDFVFADPKMVAYSFGISGSIVSALACLLIWWSIPRFDRALEAAERTDVAAAGAAA